MCAECCPLWTVSAVDECQLSCSVLCTNCGTGSSGDDCIWSSLPTGGLIDVIGMLLDSVFEINMWIKLFSFLCSLILLMLIFYPFSTSFLKDCGGGDGLGTLKASLRIMNAF